MKTFPVPAPSFGLEPPWRKPLFRLTLATLLCRKTFVIFVVLLVLLPIFLPLMTPWEEKPQLLQPAQVQTAWSLLWLVALGWLFHQSASFGERWSSFGVLEYFKSTGTSRWSLMTQVWLGCLALFSGFLLIVLAICLGPAMPGRPGEGRMWIETNLQYAFLFTLTVAPLALLAQALATRINAIAAYAVTVGLAIYGLHGIGYLDFFLSRTGHPFFNLLYALSPHYHLADLTNRLVFKLGALPATEFFNLTLYFSGLGLITCGLAYALFRESR